VQIVAITIAAFLGWLAIDLFDLDGCLIGRIAYLALGAIAIVGGALIAIACFTYPLRNGW